MSVSLCRDVILWCVSDSVSVAMSRRNFVVCQTVSVSLCRDVILWCVSVSVAVSRRAFVVCVRQCQCRCVATYFCGVCQACQCRCVATYFCGVCQTVSMSLYRGVISTTHKNTTPHPRASERLFNSKLFVLHIILVYLLFTNLLEFLITETTKVC